MTGVSRSHYYKCEGKTGQIIEFSFSQQVMNLPFVCGVDSTGAVLVADHRNKNFQVHGRDGQWSVWSLLSHTIHMTFFMILTQRLSGYSLGIADFFSRNYKGLTEAFMVNKTLTSVTRLETLCLSSSLSDFSSRLFKICLFKAKVQL